MGLLLFVGIIIVDNTGGTVSNLNFKRILHFISSFHRYSIAYSTSSLLCSNNINF